ncbi:methyltransferase family protein [Gordonia sp. CPCC 205333]|uniref:methyltransferase family protein n=1 Tax=Gordonia sp. CPCC 205333 TaxID=3140790 RepID=UPI003AF3E417
MTPDVVALRPLFVLIPVVLAGGLWLAVNDIRRRSAAVLALLWNLIGLTALNVLAISVGWWSFDSAPAALLGVPVDLLLAWAILWSVIPVLSARWIPLPYTVTALIVLDVYAMPALRPVVELRGDWWWGELIGVVTCLIPASILATLTFHRRGLTVRVGFQVTLFATMLFVVVPVLCYELRLRSGFLATAPEWRPQLGSTVDIVAIQLAGVISLAALAAVAEFTRAGGTPWPWDPPSRVVTVGPYAYVANPMQLCATLLVVIAAVVLQIPLMFVAAVMTATFSAGVAAYVEDDALTRRFGDQWSVYRRSVRNWIPHWRPAPSATAARVYLARGCDPCSDLAAWIVARRPIGLELLAAEEHSEPLRRIRYESSDGLPRSGVPAVAAVMAHLNLAWAITGWVIGTPGISHLMQLLVDASGGQARDIPTPTAQSE